jgi:hypothetical protein
MIERAPPEARADLDRKLKAGEDAAALKIMRALRYFEMYPCHICHGALPPWGTCLLNCADVVDLSHETVDVDAFIVDVLMTKVVKAEPGRARALVKPEPGLKAGSLIGTEVRKRFPGVGWYDGVVLDASGGGGGSSSMAEVQWHDGSITDMKITDVQKYAKVAAERADPTKRTAGVGSGPNKRPAEKTTGVVGIAMSALLSSTAVSDRVAAFSAPPDVYSLCLCSVEFHRQQKAPVRLLATQMLRASLESNFHRALGQQLEPLRGTLAALASVAGKGSRPGAVISGSTVVQAVLGQFWSAQEDATLAGGSDTEVQCDVDIFCTASAAPKVRTSLVVPSPKGSNFVLAGFPSGYSENGNGPSGHVLENKVHHVEVFAPRPGEDWEGDYSGVGFDWDEACKYGADFDPAMYAGTFPRDFLKTKEHKIRVLGGQKLPFNFDLMHEPQVKIDFVVGEIAVKSALEMLGAFDIVICKASFDGRVFRIPDPHSAFVRKTAMEPSRMKLMRSFASAYGSAPSVERPPIHEDDGEFDESWAAVVHVAKEIKKAGVRWDDDPFSLIERHGDSGFPATVERYYHNFFAKLFKRYHKYARRGLKFVDQTAHRQFMAFDMDVAVQVSEAG